MRPLGASKNDGNAPFACSPGGKWCKESLAVQGFRAPHMSLDSSQGSCQRGRSPSDFGSYRPALPGGRGVFGLAENISACFWRKRSRSELFRHAGRGRSGCALSVETPLWCKRAETAFFLHSHIPHIALVRPASGLLCLKKTKADARFHPPVAAFRYQFVRFGGQYALFFRRIGILQAGMGVQRTEVIQTKVLTALL